MSLLNLWKCNPHNMIKATFEAFSFMNSPSIASKRGKKVSDIFGATDNNKEDDEWYE